MSDTLQAIGQAMRAEAETLRMIGQNVANAETTAYRRQIPLMRPEFDPILGQAQAAAFATPRLEMALDQSPGTLKSTGMSLHVALDGPGYFVLQRADAVLLTRRGDLHVSKDGVLVNAQGDAVLGEQGVIQLGSGVPAIGPDGSVSVEGAVVDRLRVALPASDAALEALGDGSYSVVSGVLEEGASSAMVRQGFLEASNVVPMNEVIQMLETVRRFEAEQRFARAYDDMVGKAISELGKIG